MEKIPTKLAEPKDISSSTPSKGEELTPEQKEDIKLYQDDNDDDYDLIVEEW